MLRIYVDKDGNPVDEGDPRSARLLTGEEAEAVMKQVKTYEDKRRKVRIGDKADDAGTG